MKKQIINVRYATNWSLQGYKHPVECHVGI
jgi:hypothetical protein